jgi:hypothetical protein
LAKLGLVLDELWQPAIQQFQKLLRAHRCAVWVPEAGHHHVLDGAFLAITQLDAGFLASGLATAVVIHFAILGF